MQIRVLIFKKGNIEMKNVIKVCTLAAIFAFVAGCASHETPNEVTTPSISSTAQGAQEGQVKCKKHVRHHCGKLGAEKVTKDSDK
jgi:hypothetical protein